MTASSTSQTKPSPRDPRIAYRRPLFRATLASAVRDAPTRGVLLLVLKLNCRVALAVRLAKIVSSSRLCTWLAYVSQGWGQGQCWGSSAGERGAGAARAPLGEHSSATAAHSSAGAARPGSSEPASTIRTPKERSRGGRSPRADPAGQLRRPSTPHYLILLSY